MPHMQLADASADDASERDADSEPQLIHGLAGRFGRLHARQRLGIEQAHEARLAGPGLHFFQVDRWYSIHSLVRAALRLSLLYGRARRNAGQLRTHVNQVHSPSLPPAFDGFTLLHITDLHTDTSEQAMTRLIDVLGGLDYDICVLTGDFRGATYGPWAPAVAGVARVRRHLRGPVYGVLGNHDSIHMVPALERMGIRMLLNECVTIERGDARIHLAGVDDAHFYRLDNIEKAAGSIPDHEFAVLLSHTPEIYRQAAHAGFDLMLSGHTHGGQLCLPGRVPIRLDARMPRRFGAGAWRYHGMAGYTSAGAGTSIAEVRLNCPAEVTLHRLRCG